MDGKKVVIRKSENIRHIGEIMEYHSWGVLVKITYAYHGACEWEVDKFAVFKNVGSRLYNRDYGWIEKHREEAKK